jgi:autotransporter-associated beta strand protein
VASYSGNITLGGASSIVADNGAITLQTGTLTGAFALTLGGTTGGTVSRVIATGGGTLIKEDAGIWTLAGLNTYTGSTTISAGILKFGQHGAAGSGPLGTNAGGTVVANGAALDLAGFSENSTETLTLNGTGPGGAGALRNSGATSTYAGLISLGSASSIHGEGGTIAVSNTGTISGATFGLTLGGTQGGTMSSIIGTTTGTLTKVDAGTWTLSGVNTFTGATTISDGILQLGVANAIKYGATGARSNVVLNGGTFSSGSGAGFTDGTSANPMGTLQLTDNSNISLGTGSHSLYFAASNAVSWTASTIITITGWAGAYNGTAGTAGRIYVGSTSSGLTAGQLDQIHFFNGSTNYGATILSTGEIVAIQIAPIVSSQPTDQTVCEGSTASFTAQSTGGNPIPTATWQISTGGSFSNLTIVSPYNVSTSTVSGTTTSTLTINPTPYSYNSYQYRVIFNNSHGNAISNGAVLTVDQISVGGSVTGGTTPICIGSPTGTMSLSGQTGNVTKWQKKLDTGGWTDITNTNTTYTETPSSAGTWQYRAEVQNGVCSVAYSAARSIVVNPKPTSVISGTTSVCSGQSATISIALTGTAPWSLTYTDGTTPVNVTSIASSPYAFVVTPASTRTYTVIALSDANCTAQAGDMTGNAAITVNTGCQVVTLTQPSQLNAVISGSTAIACGNPATITVTFTGGTPPYHVIYNSITYSNPTSPVTFNVTPGTTTTYNSSNVTASDAHNCPSSTGGSAIVTVTPIAAPVATDATVVTTSGFSANWNAVSGASGYRLDVSTASNFSSFVTGYNDLDVSLVTTYPVTGLSPGVLYYYRVRVYTSICLSGNSNTKSVTTTSLTIGAPTITGAPFNVDCSTPAAGSISFTHGTFNPGNTFTAQLSDNTGSFASPVNIGSGSSSPVNITIPPNTPSGTNSYKIRVVSSNPIVTGSVSSTFTIINLPCLPMYRSFQNGYWHNTSTWRVSTDGGSNWVVATNTPDCADGSITIRNGHTVTINDSVTVNQLTVEAGGTLVNELNPAYSYYFLIVANKNEIPDHPDLIVNGTLSSEDDISILSGATISIGSGGVYQHNRTDFYIEIPAATWDVNSTCEIVACSDVAPLGLGQSFGNFDWNYTSQTAKIDLNGDLTTVNGDFTVTGTGSGILQLAASGNKTLTVGGSSDIKYGSSVDLGTNKIAGTGNFNLDAGTNLMIGSPAGITASGSTGNIQVSGTRAFSSNADYTYNGISSQFTGNGLPTSINNLKIDNSSDVTLSSNISCTGILNIAAGKLKVPSANNLTVNGATTLGTAECLVLESDATGTGSFIDNGTISGTGTARIERYLDPYFVVSDWKFHFLSSPVGAAQAIMPGFQTMTNTTDDFYMWNEPTNEWISTKLGNSAPFTWNTDFGTGNGAFVAGKGYLVAYPSSVTKNFVGKPYTSTGGLTMTCTNTYAPGTDISPGWNLLGNPFPSAIDWDLVSKGSGMDGALYYYDNGPPRYRYYVALTGGIGNALNGGSRYIPAMQGFMVHAKTTGTKTITMDNGDRVHQGMDTYYKNAQLTDNVLNISVEGNNSRDDARVCFYDQATTNFDGDFDAYKIFSYSTSIPELYSVTPDNTNVSINTLPLSQMYGTVQLGFIPGTAGNFTFTADGISNFPPTMYIKLEDKKTGTIQKLNDNPSYAFTSSTTDNTDRFVLHFQDATSVDDVTGTSDYSVYVDGGIINVLALKPSSGLVKVSDMAGREVATASMIPNRTTRIDMHGQSGIYIVSVLTNKGISNKKLVVK